MHRQPCTPAYTRNPCGARMYHVYIELYEAWYGIKPSINDLHIWGCQVFVQLPHTKKSENKAVRGYFMGFTKSRVLIRWWDPTTDQVKHAFAICFDEHNACLSPEDHTSLGSLLLTNHNPSDIILPDCSVDLYDHHHFDSAVFSFELLVPEQGTSIGCTVSVDTYYNLPYISSFLPGTQLSQQLLRHGARNSTFWLLSINSPEFIKPDAVISYLRSLQQVHSSHYTTVYCVRLTAPTRNALETNRAIFNQIRSNYPQTPPDQPVPLPLMLPIAKCLVTSLTHPATPSHVGELAANPFRSDWKGSLIDNFDKMQQTGNFSAPMLRSQVPAGKAVLRSCITFHVKYGNTANIYDLYSRTCADGSSMRVGVDFHNSYSPVGSIDSIRLIVALAASQGLQLFALDISNAFKNISFLIPSSASILLSHPFIWNDSPQNGLTINSHPSSLKTSFYKA
jgi:hypothetical protein